MTPPRTMFFVFWKCGQKTSCYTRGEADLIRVSVVCSCEPKCGSRIVSYRRGSLFGRGSATWPTPKRSKT
jgi:hypothetical protein